MTLVNNAAVSLPGSGRLAIGKMLYVWIDYEEEGSLSLTDGFN